MSAALFSDTEVRNAFRDAAAAWNAVTDVNFREVSSSQSNAGYVHFLYGSADGLDWDGDQGWCEDSSGIAGACEAGDNFGYSLAAADFDGDGYVDLVVGALGEAIGLCNFFHLWPVSITLI